MIETCVGACAASNVEWCRFRIWSVGVGLGFRIWSVGVGLGFRIWGLGLGFKVWGLGW